MRADLRGSARSPSPTGTRSSAQAGLKSGDTLIGLNGTRVRTAEDVDHVLQRDFNKNTVLIEIGRGRFSYSVSLPLD